MELIEQLLFLLLKVLELLQADFVVPLGLLTDLLLLSDIVLELFKFAHNVVVLDL